MENMNPESLLRKAQALGDDIKEMESIDVMGAYRQTQAKIKTNRRKGMYNQLMRYAAFLTIPLLLTSLLFGYLYFDGADEEEQYKYPKRDRKSTRLNSSHIPLSRMPSSA